MFCSFIYIFLNQPYAFVDLPNLDINTRTMTTVNNSHPVDIVIKSKDEFHQTLFNVRIPDGTTEVSNKAFAGWDLGFYYFFLVFLRFLSFYFPVCAYVCACVLCVGVYVCGWSLSVIVSGSMSVWCVCVCVFHLIWVSLFF